MSKNTLEQQIELFLRDWGGAEMVSFFKDIIPLFDLYNCTEENDWVIESVGKDDARNIRLIRTAYLMSRIAEFHAGKLALLKINHKDLWRKMEKKLDVSD